MNPGLRLAQSMGCAWQRNSRFVVEELAHFNEEIDHLLDELMQTLGVTTYRSAAILNWKFLGRPQGKHFVLAVRDAHGALRGYAAVKMMRRGDVRWGEITDVLAPPNEPEIFRTLLRASVRRCLSFDADFVRFRCSHPAQTALLRPPFWVRRNRPVIDDVLYWSRHADVIQAVKEGPFHLTSVVSDRTDHGRDEF
jgi:hypothetical protein